jgi:hypothetical protein
MLECVKSIKSNLVNLNSSTLVITAMATTVLSKMDMSCLTLAQILTVFWSHLNLKLGMYCIFNITEFREN